MSPLRRHKPNFNALKKLFWQQRACWACCCILLALTPPVAKAGLIIENDGSDLCNTNLRDCSSRCAAPQSFIFMCNSGGTFNKPQSDCKCTPAPPADGTTDGSGIFQLVQWPGPQACQGSTWLFDCAQFLNLQIISGNMQGQAQDQASAMAAVAAAQAAREAQQAAMAAAQQQLAAMQQQQAAAGASATPAGAPAGASAVPGLGAPAGVPGLDGSSAIPPAAGAAMTGPGAMPGQAVGAATGPDAMAAGPAMGPGAGMMGATSAAGPPASSLMASNSLGHRHLLQVPALGSGSAASSLPMSVPTTQLGPACQKPIQGLVTGAGAGVWIIPAFKGVASVSTRGNDTMMVQLGGQGSSCMGAYKLLSGQVMGLGQAVAGPATQNKTATSAAGGVAISGGVAFLAALTATLVFGL